MGTVSVDDLISDFIAETREGIEALDSELVRFEQYPDDPELLSSVFRLIHTIKGTCGFLGLMRLQTVAHAGETVLGGFRDGSVPVSGVAVTAVLDMVDLIRFITEALASTGAEPVGDDSELIARLEAVLLDMDAGASGPSVEGLTDRSPAPDGNTAQEKPEHAAAVAIAGDVRSLIARLGGDATIDAAAEMALARIQASPCFAGSDPDLLQSAIRDSLCAAARRPEQPATFKTTLLEIAPSASLEGAITAAFEAVADGLRNLDIDDLAVDDLRQLIFQGPAAEIHRSPPPKTHVDLEARPTPAALVAPVPAPSPTPVDRPVLSAQLKQPQIQTVAETPSLPLLGEPIGPAQTIRVSVDALEHLMTVVSELVLIRNQLIQTLRLQPESPFAAPLNRLNQVTSELQEGVMTARMQPISGAWAKLPRLVRDLAQDLGKSIDLVMFGQETELDRQVLELIKDPLTHMIRNAADHGLETREVRLAAGKSATGRITLQARHEGGAIVIEIV